MPRRKPENQPVAEQPALQAPEMSAEEQLQQENAYLREALEELQASYDVMKDRFVDELNGRNEALTRVKRLEAGIALLQQAQSQA